MRERAKAAGDPSPSTPEGLSEPRRAARQAAELVLLRTSAVWTGIWGLGLVAGVLAPGSGLRSPLVAYLGLGLLSTSWVVCLLLRLLSAWIFAGVLAVTAVAQVVNTVPVALAGPYAVLVPWISLTVVMAAFLLSRRWSLLVIWSVAASSLALLFADATATGSLTESWRASALLPAYAVCVGMVSAGIAAALHGIASEVDTAADTSRIVAAQEDRTRARSEETLLMNRTLHDTVINTFGAIRAFGDIGEAESARLALLVRQRSASDLSALSPGPESASDQPTAVAPLRIADLVSHAEGRSRLLGLRLRCAARGELPAMASNVRSALLAALDEALLNVSKHAGTDRADLTLIGSNSRFDIRLRDHGCGYDGGEGNRDPGGLSIVGRCLPAGIDAAIGESPDGGTVVRLRWAVPAAPAPACGRNPSSALLAVLVPTVTRLSAWFTALFALNTLLVVGDEPVGWTLVGLGLFSAVAALAVLSARRGIPVSWRVSVTLAVSAGFVAFLPTAGVIGCSRIGTGWWGSLSGTACVVLLVLLSGRTVWVAAGALCYLLGIAAVTGQLLPEAGGCAAESIPLILLTDAALVLAAILFRRLLQRHGDQAEASRRATLEAQTNIIQIQERERIRDRRMRSVLQSVGPLLSGLADGRLSPADPVVRNQCARQEAYLRSLLRIHQDLGALGDALAVMVSRAREIGASVVIRATEPCLLPGDPAMKEIQATLTAAVRFLWRGTEAIVTQFSESGGGALTIMGPTRAGAQPFLPTRDGSVRVERDVEDDRFWIELSWR